MKLLRDMLLRPLGRNARTEFYQEALDNEIERLLPRFDYERGLHDSVGVALPHEEINDYWNIPYAERPPISDEAGRVYLENSHRNCTPWFGVTSFCWWSPLSRFHGDERLLRWFEAGLDFFTSTVRDDGTGLSQLAPAIPKLSNYPVNDWSHTWAVEGLLYGLVRHWDALDPALRDRALARLRNAADAFHARGPSGEYGNQGVIQALGLFYYADLLNEPRYRATAEAYWADVRDKVMDPSGEVIEQSGPCMHYSVTAFFYLWLTGWFLGDPVVAERLPITLEWFRRRHTKDLTPLAGASARKYRERLNPHMVDLLAACEQVAPDNPMFQRFADQLMDGVGRDALRTRYARGHGNSPIMWALQACPGELAPTPEQEAAWRAPFAREYRKVHILARGDSGCHYGPIRYALVQRRYQTQYTFADSLPFAGLQTWALDEEPPIIHPTPYCPSTTQAWGLDIARQGARQDVPTPEEFGGQSRPGHLLRSSLAAPFEGGELDVLLARFDYLWQIVVFTPHSTVLVNWGATGPFKTVWTLNRTAPATPEIGRGIVRFAGRAGMLHTDVTALPELSKRKGGEWLDGVEQLVYDYEATPAVFAFSDESFALAGWSDARTLVFSDAGGNAELTISPDLPTGDDYAEMRIDLLLGETKAYYTG